MPGHGSGRPGHELHEAPRTGARLGLRVIVRLLADHCRHQEGIDPGPLRHGGDVGAPAEGIQHLPERTRQCRVAGGGKVGKVPSENPEREVIALVTDVDS